MEKNRYTIFCLLILLTQVAYSQEVQDDFFYRDACVKRTLVNYEESTFVCDTLNNSTICIYNSEDKYWGKEQKFIDDSEFTYADIVGRTNFINITPAQVQHLHNIVDNAFSAEMTERLNGELLLISIDVNSTDGSIMGVGFIFDKGYEFANMPISIYKGIEDEIKHNFIFDITERGKKLNYNTTTWLQCPKGREDSGMTIPEDGGGMLTMPGGKLDGTIGGTIGTPSTTPTMP